MRVLIDQYMTDAGDDPPWLYYFSESLRCECVQKVDETVFAKKRLFRVYRYARVRVCAYTVQVYGGRFEIARRVAETRQGCRENIYFIF